MTEVLAVCQGKRWPRGRGISVVTGSGGLSELILDNATAAGLHLPPLSAEERAEAEHVIGRITGDGNPFDAWGNGNYAVNIPHAMAVVDKSDRINSILYCADASNDPIIGQPSRVFENVDMLTKAAAASAEALLPHEHPLGRHEPQADRRHARRRPGRDRRHAPRTWCARPHRPLELWIEAGSRGRSAPAAISDALKDRATINEFDAKRLLATYGIPIAQEQRVRRQRRRRPRRARSAIRSCSRALDPIAHKTELGLVAVNLKDDAALMHAHAQLHERLEKLDPRPVDAAFLVQEFVAGGIEVFAGVSRDPDFGLPSPSAWAASPSR